MYEIIHCKKTFSEINNQNLFFSHSFSNNICSSEKCNRDHIFWLVTRINFCAFGFQENVTYGLRLGDFGAIISESSLICVCKSDYEKEINKASVQLK